jgi:hypothetical protein
MAKDVATSVAKPKSLPTKNLPTGRISLQKQIEILRAYAASSEPEGRAVSNADVGEVVGMAANTVSLANAFFTSTGLLERTEDGYIPSAEVMNFFRAYPWDPEVAPHKLRPLIEKAWFSLALLPKLRFRQMEEKEAISDLAEIAQAGPEYKAQLALLLDFMATAGMIVKENNTIRLISSETEEVQPPPPNPSANGDGETQTQDMPLNPEFSTSFAKNGGGIIQLAINVNVDMQEVSKWSSDRISAFFRGIAMVLAAKNAKEMKEIEEDT